jgi:ribose transport system ATP-binding protein
MPILRLTDISKGFGQTTALDGVDLSLEKGEIHALIGENGAGKSTLMNVISGSIRPDHGSMELKDERYQPSDPLDSRRNGIALIHQELSLAPHLTVAENILMGIEAANYGWLDRRGNELRASSVLDNFNHPDITTDVRVSKLSPAAQQVVEICRSLAANAEIILMDEPTSSLQRDDVTQLFALIRKLKAGGISVIYISHFLEEVREIADRFTVLRDGKSVASGNISDVSESFLISQMVGRSIGQLFPSRSASASKDAAIEVKGLSSPPALVDASFELKRGEILGIAGLMGSGRTDMVRAILGIKRAASGMIRINGKLLSARGGTPAMRLLQGLGYLSEDRKGEGLALSSSIADNITLTRFSSCSRFGWLNLSKQRKTSMALVDNVGVRAKTVHQPVGTLSGGNQQKVAIARLLHQQADILVLDEPTRGIDIGSKAKIYEVIADLADQGKAILMISSYLPELFGMCDRLAVMTRGRLSKARPIAEWTPESVLQTAIETGDPLLTTDGNGH